MTTDISAETTEITGLQKWRAIQVCILVVLVSVAIAVGWYGVWCYQASLKKAVIASWQQTQLEVVRLIARCITQYVDDHSGLGTSSDQLE